MVSFERGVVAASTTMSDLEPESDPRVDASGSTGGRGIGPNMRGVDALETVEGPEPAWIAVSIASRNVLPRRMA